MYWKISELPADLRSRLLQIQKDGALAGVPSLLIRRDRGRALAWSLVVGLVLSGLYSSLAWALLSGTESRTGAYVGLAIGAIAPFWTLLVIAELARSLSSPLRPWTLLTPKVLVLTDYAHGEAQFYALKDATNFKSVDTYDQKQQFSGRTHHFSFGPVLKLVEVKDRAAIEECGRLLDLAKQGAGPEPLGLDLVPASGGDPKGRRENSVFNPFGTPWLLLLGLIIIGVFVTVILAKIFKW